MKPIHCYASERHYVDHLEPLWTALEPQERGLFLAGSREAYQRAESLQIANLRLSRAMLPPRRTVTRDGHQPHVLVAGYSDLIRIGAHRRAVLLEHGAGQHYGGDGGTAAQSPYHAGGRDRGRVDLFLCPNEVVALRNGNVYPNAAHVAVGCPKLDRYLAQQGPRDRWAVTFHWECDLVPEAQSCWPLYREEVARLAAAGAPMLGHGHPRSWGHVGKWWPAHGVEAEQYLERVLPRAELLIADNTSAMWEACALGIPIVIVNHPDYRRDVNHGLRFWQYADAGPQVDAPEQLEAAINAVLREDRWADRRAQVARELYGDLDGRAAERGVAAMREVLP